MGLTAAADAYTRTRPAQDILIHLPVLHPRARTGVCGRLGPGSSPAEPSALSLPAGISPLAGEIFRALRAQNGVLADHPHAQQYSTLQVRRPHGC